MKTAQERSLDCLRVPEKEGGGIDWKRACSGPHPIDLRTRIEANIADAVAEETAYLRAALEAARSFVIEKGDPANAYDRALIGQVDFALARNRSQ